MAATRNLQPESGLLTREIVIERIEARLVGELSDAAMAAWAFDRFYAQELGVTRFEAGAEELIADILDILMFADEGAFRLKDEELRSLAARLRKP